MVIRIHKIAFAVSKIGATFNKLFTASRTKSKGENFYVVIRIFAFIFDDFKNFMRVLDGAIGKQKYTLFKVLSRWDFTSETGLEWFKDFGSSKVCIEVINLIDGKSQRFIVVIYEVIFAVDGLKL